MSSDQFEAEEKSPTGQYANRFVNEGLEAMRGATEDGDPETRQAAIESTAAAIAAGSKIRKGGSDGPEIPSPTSMAGVSDRSKK